VKMFHKYLFGTKQYQIARKLHVSNGALDQQLAVACTVEG